MRIVAHTVLHLTDLRVCVRFSQDDDEFEEFEQQEWTNASEDVQDPTMWQDGWEDDEEDADFTAQLRKELDATEGQSAPTGALAEKMQQ